MRESVSDKRESVEKTVREVNYEPILFGLAGGGLKRGLISIDVVKSGRGASTQKVMARLLTRRQSLSQDVSATSIK